jgi:hypothetical protein
MGEQSDRSASATKTHMASVFNSGFKNDANALDSSEKYTNKQPPQIEADSN